MGKSSGWLFVWMGLVALACGQGAPAPAPGEVTFEQLQTEYIAREKAVDDEIEPALAAARSHYVTELEALRTKLESQKRSEVAEKVQKELKRFSLRGLDGVPDPGLPGEVRTAWANLQRSMEIPVSAVAVKRSALRGKYVQALNALAIQRKTAKDTAGLAPIQVALSSVAIRNYIEAKRIAPTEIAGTDAEAWQEVAKEGGYLVGFEGGAGQWYQFRVLGGLKPIFATAQGLRDGERRGKAKGTRIVAKEGYAVGGIRVSHGAVIDRVQIIFMRLNYDGLSLNPQDSYYSDWLGEKLTSKPKDITARGRLIVGITGKNGDVVESIGLVALK